MVRSGFVASNADRLAAHVLSLPVFPELSAESRQSIATTLLGAPEPLTLDVLTR